MQNKTISQHAFNLLEYYECGGDLNNHLKAYLCPAGKWTIGMGNTYYANAVPVKHGDVITRNQALDLFYETIKDYEFIINFHVTKPLKQCQFDALVCFVYNVGRQSFILSTLCKKVNHNPDDASIHDEFMKWVYITNPKTKKKVISQGLVNRRKSESDLYFNK